MGKGASGGPIFTTDAQIISANSHCESEDGVTRKNDDLFGSEHGDQAVAVINEINSKTGTHAKGPTVPAAVGPFVVAQVSPA